MLKRLAAIAFSSCLLSACITAYKGPPPDLSLTGAAAEAEIRRFSLAEGFWSQGQVHWTMGPEFRPYYIDSLEPVVRPVSPEAWKIQERGRFWRKAGTVAITAALALLAVELADGDGEFFSRDQSIVYYSLLGAAIGGSVMRAHSLDRAATRYNEDLRAKFTPVLGLRIPFD